MALSRIQIFKENIKEKRNMKKTILTCLAFVAISLCLFVSCNGEQALPDEADALAYIRFGENSRGLSADYEAAKYDDLYWFYTAKKTDKYGTTGQTSSSTNKVTLPGEKGEAVPVVGTAASPSKGLKLDSSTNNGYLGPFSQGDWEFNLYAYKCDETSWSSDKSTLVYKAENIKYTLKAGESRSIPVDVKPEGSTGTVVFNDAYFEYKDSGATAPNLTLELKSSSETEGNSSYSYTFSTTYTQDNTDSKQYQLKLEKDNSNQKRYNISFANNANGIQLEVGDDGSETYTCIVTVSFDAKDNGSADTETFTELTQTFYFGVYSGGATTTISGDLIEDPNAYWKFDVTEYTLKKVDLSSLEKGVQVGNANLTFSGVDSSKEKTTSYFVDISESNKQVTADSFGVSDKDGVEGAVNRVYTITLKDEDQNELDLKETLGTGVKVTAVLKVDKGLNGGKDYFDSEETAKDHKHGENSTWSYSTTGDDATCTTKEDCSVTVKYNGTGEEPALVSYCAYSGELTMTTTHFSEFVVIETSKLPVSVTDSTNNNTKYYASLENAFKSADANSTIKLLNDVTLKADVEAKNTVTLDLGGKIVTPNGYSVIVGKDATLTVKNGAAEGQSDFVVGVKTVKTENQEYEYAHAVASNGTTCYSTLKAAVDGTTSGTINLLDDVTESAAITVGSGKSLVIRLNDHTVTFAADLSPAIKNDGTLNINNGTIKYSGTLKSTDSSGSSNLNRTIIENNGTLKTINLTVTGDITADYNLTLSDNIQSQIDNDNTCPTVALLINNKSASLDNSTLTLNVGLPTSSTSPVKKESSTTYFAGAKPIIVYQGAGASTEIRNKSTLKSDTKVPGGVLGLYMLIMDKNTSDSTATISDSTIEVSNNSYGWTRPVFAESRSSSAKTTVTITKSEIKSTNKLTSSMVSGAGLSGINASDNRVYGLRAKGNSVIYVDSSTKLIVEKGEGQKITYAGENGTHALSGDSATDIYGEIINSTTGEGITVKVGDYASFADAVKYAPEGSTIQLDAETTVSDTITFEKKDLTIDLNNQTLKSDISADGKSTFELPTTEKGKEYAVTVKNGTISGKSGENIFTLYDNTTLNLESVKVDNFICKRGIQVKDCSVGATVNIKECKDIKVDGWYVVATNALVKDGHSENITVNITNSNLEANCTTDNTTRTKYDGSGLLLNVPGDYTISDSTIKGQLQAAIFRGGTYNVSGSTFEYKDSENKNSTYDTSAWIDGNGVPNAAIVIGNKDNEYYAYPTTVTFSGSNTLTVPTGSTNSKQLYIYQYDNTANRKVTVTGFDKSWSVNDDFNGATVTSADGNTIYVAADLDDFDTAVANAKSGQTIMLLKDLNFAVAYYPNDKGHKLQFNDNVTVDLNEKTFTSNNCGVFWKGNGLTIKNGKLVAKSTNTSQTNGSYAIRMGKGKNDDGNYPDETEMTWKATLENLTCTGGIFVSSHQVTVKNCDVTGTNYYALYSQNSGLLTVDSGTYKSNGGGLLYAGSKTVVDQSVLDGNESIIGTIIINGGTYGEAGKSSQTFVSLGDVSKGSVKVQGGTFYVDPEKYLAEGYKATKSTDGSTWTVETKN